MIRPLLARIPAPVWVRVLLVLALIVAIAAACHYWWFPAIDAALFPPEVVPVGPEG